MKRTFFAFLAFVCFLGFLGSVGGMEQKLMTFGQGLVWMGVFLAGMIAFVLVSGKE